MAVRGILPILVATYVHGWQLTGRALRPHALELTCHPNVCTVIANGLRPTWDEVREAEAASAKAEAATVADPENLPLRVSPVGSERTRAHAN